MAGTRHDLITELFDLDDLVASDPTDERVGERVERIVQWARVDVARLCDVVAARDTDSKRDPDIEVAHVLVMESAANLLQANRPMQAAEAVLRPVRGVRLTGAAPP